MGRPAYCELKPYYKLEKKIGEGGFAKVRLATHLPTGEKVAIKIMEKANLGKDLARVLSEVEALKSLTHQHISQVYEVIETPERIFIIMEYCSGGELFDYIVHNKRLSESEARGFFRQILSAVAFLHKKGYAHRDLKPENILLDRDHNLKLIDFGLCARPTGGISVCLNTACGSLNYAAPELLLGVKYLGSVADVWSLGVLLYALLCGALPFDDSSGMAGELHRKIIAGRYEEPQFLSKLSREILRGMLQKDPQMRLTSEELLNHKWVTLDFYDPVCYLPIHQHHERDDQILSVLSDYYDMTVQSAWHRLSTWSYDCFTASYLLLLNKKRRGLSFSFCTSTPIKQTKLKETGRKGSREISEKLHSRSPLSPAHPSYSRMVDNMQTRCNSLELDTVVTRSRLSRKRGHDAAHGNDIAVSPFISTPVKKRRRTSGGNSENNTPTNGSSTPGKFLQSVENRLNKMRNILTPKRKPDPDSPVLLNSKDLHDVSVTSSCDPKKVLDDLSGALSSHDIVCKLQGFVIRGKVFDGGINKGKSSACKLMFELEVCWVKSGQRPPVVGIRRKRLKGDSFYYKKICEQILQLTVK